MKTFDEFQDDTPIEISITVSVGDEQVMIDEFYSLEDLEEKLYKIDRAVYASLRDQYEYYRQEEAE